MIAPPIVKNKSA